MKKRISIALVVVMLISMLCGINAFAANNTATVSLTITNGTATRTAQTTVNAENSFVSVAAGLYVANRDALAAAYGDAEARDIADEMANRYLSSTWADLVNSYEITYSSDAFKSYVVNKSSLEEMGSGTYVSCLGKYTITAIVTINAVIEEEPIIDIPGVPTPTRFFVDVAPGAWYEEYANTLYKLGITNGIGDHKFGPDLLTTRGMFVTWLYRIQGQPAYTGVNSFNDVENGAYYYDAVNWAVENGIVNGYSETVFAPNDPITREQIANILWKLSGKPAAEAVNTGCSVWAIEGMNWAVSTKLMLGDSVGYRPADKATRAECAALLVRFINK